MLPVVEVFDHCADLFRANRVRCLPHDWQLLQPGGVSGAVLRATWRDPGGRSDDASLEGVPRPGEGPCANGSKHWEAGDNRCDQ